MARLATEAATEGRFTLKPYRLPPMFVRLQERKATWRERYRHPGPRKYLGPWSRAVYKPKRVYGKRWLISQSWAIGRALNAPADPLPRSQHAAALAEVYEAAKRGVPREFRDDVIQETALAVFDGRISRDKIAEAMRVIVGRYRGEEFAAARMQRLDAPFGEKGGSGHEFMNGAQPRKSRRPTIY